MKTIIQHHLEQAHLFRLNNLFELFYKLICASLSKSFGFKNTLDYDWRILGSDLDKLIKSIAKNDSKYSSLFQVKVCREKSKHVNRKKFLEMINKYLKAWGMNKIVCLKKPKKQVKKKRVYNIDKFEYGFYNKYNLTYQEPPQECLISVDSDD